MFRIELKKVHENIHVMAADRIINQDCVTKKSGYYIPGQTFDVNKDSLLMHDEANDYDSYYDIESSNDLRSYNNVEM